MGGVGFQLLAQAADVYGDGAGIDVFTHPPHQIQQAVAVEDLAGMPSHQIQQIEFPGGERDFPISYQYLPGVGIDGQPVEGEYGLPARGGTCASALGASQNRPTLLTSSRGLNGLTT